MTMSDQQARGDELMRSLLSNLIVEGRLIILDPRGRQLTPDSVQPSPIDKRTVIVRTIVP